MNPSPNDEPWRNGSCHCGKVKFRTRLKGGLLSARRCTCSFCRMRGAVALTADPMEFEIIAGEENLTLYRFNTGTAKHYFCSTCGIYTHHQRRSNPNEYGINAACLENVSPFDFVAVQVDDGINHPSDGKSGVVGTLIFQKR